MDDLSDLILDIIYEYICEKQTEILFKVNWKMQVVNPKHFIDHFVRVLPSLDALQMISTRQNKILKSEESQEERKIDFRKHSLRSPTSKEKKITYKVLRDEIEDCIDSVAKLAPLVPCYIEFNSAEVASAALMIAIKHSIKTILNEGDCDQEEVNRLKLLYSRWTASLFKKYYLSKSRVTEF